MFLLIAEFTHLFDHITAPELQGTFLYAIGRQFHHVAWEGLHFWDLIQPFFMFIVGVAMPISFFNRMRKGQSYRDITVHVIKRSFLLLLLGWALYCIEPGRIVFRFQNVLAQLSVTYLLAFVVMRKGPAFQIVFSLALILINEALYRFFSVSGFDQPFEAGHNFGAWFNILISGQEDGGHWAMSNAIPTAAHTIWGVLAGQLLMGDRKSMSKMRILVATALVCLILGYGLSVYTPIIKRIATSTFVLASGGWTLLALAVSFWVIDIKKYHRGVLFFAIVGMNPLFIYLFAHVGGAELIRKIVLPFSNAIFLWMGEVGAEIMLSLITLFLLWYMCRWLYERKIFFRI